MFRKAEKLSRSRSKCSTASDLLARAKSLRDGKAVRGDSPSYLVKTNGLPSIVYGKREEW